MKIYFPLSDYQRLKKLSKKMSVSGTYVDPKTGLSYTSYVQFPTRKLITVHIYNVKSPKNIKELKLPFDIYVDSRSVDPVDKSLLVLFENLKLTYNFK